jgi:hypothetical protein
MGVYYRWALGAWWTSAMVAFGGPDSESIHRTTERVYARPEFNTAHDDSWAWLVRWLHQFLHWLGSLHATSPALYWIILGGCVLVLALILAHLIVTVVGAVRYGKEPGEFAHSEARRRLSTRHKADAEANAAAGRYTEAVRSLFLSLVYAFDEAGRLSFRPSLTNREYLRYFDDRPLLGRDLGVFVDILDANWYGRQDTAAEQYSHCAALYDQIRNRRT